MSKALKCVSALLTSAVFLSSSVYATEQKMTKDELSVLYYNDGSNVDGIYGEGVRNLFVMNNGAGEHKSYWKYGQSTQILQFLKDIYDGETPTTKWGLAQISFDICAKQKDHFIISEIRDTKGNGIATFFMNGMGKMAFQKGGAWPTATYEPDCARDYETDVWYNIKILFDFRNRKIDYFCDNEFWGSSVISGDIMNSETDAEVSAINFNIMTNYTIKGGIAVQSDGTEEFYIDNLTYGIPMPYDAKINLSTQNDGNIFFEKDKIKLDLNIINMTEKDEKYSLKTVIKNEGNKTVWQEAKEIIVNKNSEVYAEATPIVDKFGFYDAEVILTDKNGNVAATQSTRFSVANRGDDGIVNNKMGVANHFGHNLGDMNVILPLERRLGFAWGRDDVPWAHVVSNSGEVMPATAEAERFDKWTNLAEEKNVNILGILGSGHAGMGIDWPASTENVNNKNGLAKYEEYTEAISKLKPSVEAWELFNEWNINSNTANGGSPEAYAEVLRHGARGVRKGNPNAKIVGFCTALVDTEWIEKVIIALGDNPGQYFDAISVHPYVTTGDKPENGNIDAELENLEHMLVKYGLQDKELWITEIGYSTGAVVNKVTEKLQAEYTIREAAIVEHYADTIDWYTITQKQDTTEAEMGFGALRTYSGIDIPYEARPMALALANYNTLMSDSRYMGNRKTEDSSYVYRYKTRNENDMLLLWNAEEEKDISVSLGTDCVTIYDIYGNAEKIYAVDGVHTFRIGSSPIYIEGTIPVFEICEESVFSLKDNNFVVTECDDFEIFIADKTGKDLKKDIDLSDNITVTSSKNIGDKTVFELATGDNHNEVAQYKFDDLSTAENIEIRINDGTRTYYKANISVDYRDILETQLEILPYKNGRWQAILNIKNNKASQSVSGTATVDVPTEMSKLTDAKKFDNIPAGGSAKLVFNIPEFMTATNQKLTFSTTVDGIQTRTVSGESHFITLARGKTKPVIDGVISGGEWQTQTPLVMDNVKQVKQIADWKGVDDLSGKIYLMYDEDYLYLGGIVNDDTHCGYDEGDRLWSMDSIQFAVAPEQSSTAKRTEIGIALTDDGAKINRYSYAGTVSLLGIPESALEYDLNEFVDTEVEIKRTGNQTVYELKIPWGELLGEKVDVKKLNELICSVIINDNDGKGRRGWIEFCGGIGTYKNPALFTKIPMIK